jgi:hypothetical protein
MATSSSLGAKGSKSLLNSEEILVLNKNEYWKLDRSVRELFGNREFDMVHIDYSKESRHGDSFSHKFVIRPRNSLKGNGSGYLQGFTLLLNGEGMRDGREIGEVMLNVPRGEIESDNILCRRSEDYGMLVRSPDKPIIILRDTLVRLGADCDTELLDSTGLLRAADNAKNSQKVGTLANLVQFGIENSLRKEIETLKGMERK